MAETPPTEPTDTAAAAEAKASGTTDDTAPPEETFTVEEGVPMSQSLVWKLQRNFYTQRGMDAWREQIVPNYITSNTFIADVYARMVCGYARDCVAAGLDTDEPIYVVELGAGHGRFSFYFLSSLAERQTHPDLADVRFVLVMTDLADQNIEAWEKHPQLEPLVKEGRLDFARFDAESDKTLVLRHGDKRIEAGDLANPLVVIANYFFDSIPQDVFYVDENHVLLECPVTLTSVQEESDLEDPALLERLRIYFDARDVKGDYYPEPEFNDLLELYRARLERSTISFPISALRCLDVLRNFAGGRMLLVTADKGHIHDESVLSRSVPQVAVHGSISMDVNYHLMASWTRRLGGHVLAHKHHSVALNVSGFLFGPGANEGLFVETEVGFADAVERFGPDDYYSLKQALAPNHADLSVREMLALIRLSGYDPLLLSQCTPQLYKKLDTSGEAREVIRMVDLVWRRYYHLGEGLDLAFNIGTLMGLLAQFEKALVFFHRSYELNGHDTNVLFNIGLCHLQLDDPEQAKMYAEKILAEDPEHEAGKRLMERALNPGAAPPAD